jgi:hypothetical protein
LIVIGNAAVADAATLSVTLTVKLLDPAAVGVPEIVPFAASISPAGSDPLAIVHVKGGVPPIAASVWEYAVPTIPVGSDEVEICKAGGLIVIDNAAAADVDGEALSATFTVKLLDPAAVGVPEIVPFAASISPAGSDPLAIVHA